MNNPEITSEPATPTQKTKKHAKHKMSAAQRKALSDAAKERWAARQALQIPASIPPLQAVPIAPAAPLPPSPAVLQLQEQVVELVAQRSGARQRLAEAHSAYLLAQCTFQAAEANVKAAEQDAQYLIGLIAQLENRPAPTSYVPAAPLQFPPSGSMAGVSSEPSQPAQGQRGPQQSYAIADATDLRRGMM